MLSSSTKSQIFSIMAVQIHFFTLISVLASSSFSASAASNSSIPKFSFDWLDDKSTFIAGDAATIKIKVLGNFDNASSSSLGKTAFKPSLSVNGKIGNSSYISGVLQEEEDTNSWKISFIPIMTGSFDLEIIDDPFEVHNDSLHFKVEPGKLYLSVCVVSLSSSLVKKGIEAGKNTTLLILPKDAFGNNVNLTNQELGSFYNITVSVFDTNGSLVSVPNITYKGLNEYGSVDIKFIVTIAGNFLLSVQVDNQTLNGSPLPFKVNPGPLNVSNCVAKSKFEVVSWQILSKMEIFIHQQDQYGNLVPGFYRFDAVIAKKEATLSIPVIDMHFEQVAPGIQLFSYTIEQSGNFSLKIFDMAHSNKTISNMPYNYTVFIGSLSGTSSVINGSGLNDSVAGQVVGFHVYVIDTYPYPYTVEVEMLQVQIIREIDSYPVRPSILPFQAINDTGEPSDHIIYQTELAPAPSPDSTNISSQNSKVLASVFEVKYRPERSGTYKIFVLCGNIVFNGGIPFKKVVKPDEVNISLSSVVSFAPKVHKLTKHEIVVRLLDSFSNPVLSQEAMLKLERNQSVFSNLTFVDNNDGLYTGQYEALDVGTYEMRVSFNGTDFSTPPLVVEVFSGQYFPYANSDTVFVWEDESISFDALENDSFDGQNASIANFSNPSHGSLLQYDRIFRYTPYKDYSGSDSFLYTFSDVNGNRSTAAVNISVLRTPPCFVSFQSQLRATEDVLSPRFGGFPGFEIRNLEMNENISVTISARSGTVFLSSMLMQFWPPMWSELSVRNGEENMKDLILEGSVEEINVALQSIQYLGNENFYGEDTVTVTARNKNFKIDLSVPVLLDPVNDPPFIEVPEYIILKGNGDESQIFNKEIDEFNFFVGDPDVFSFPGNVSEFIVAFSLEVSEGILLTSLPDELVNTTELKLDYTYQWQPLLTYVTISKHFMVKAKGIRFRGTVDNCNSVMQELFYYGGGHDAILTIKLNDMGQNGSYPDCAENISVPLYAEATVNLFRRGPMSSLVAHTLGSAVAIEFMLVFSFGVLLLFFTCKCAILLVIERRSSGIRNPEPSVLQSLEKQTEPSIVESTEKQTEPSIVESSEKQNSGTDLLEDDATTYYTGFCSTVKEILDAH